MKGQARARLTWPAVFALGLSLSGCTLDPGGGAGTPSSGAAPAPEEATGTVGLELMLPSGQRIDVVNWAISGPNGGATVVKSGAAPTRASGLSFLVGGIAPGTSYRVALSGTVIDGSVTCTGSAPFDIAPRTTTNVSVALACAVSTGGAHVTLVNGTSFDCAAASGIAASPTETTLGHSVSLTAVAQAPKPGALTYAWSAPSGTFGTASASMTSFTCTEVGPVTVSVAVGDGPVPPGQSCAASLDTATAVITCDEPPPEDAGTDAGGTGGVDAGTSHPVPALPPFAVAGLGGALLASASMLRRRRAGSGR